MRTSIGTGLVLIAVGGVLAFAVRAPGEVEQYVDVIDLGLILIWTGALVLVSFAWFHGPRRRRSRRRDPGYDENHWYEHDVHRPGYAGETRRLPMVRGGRRR